jgi:large subunit ribosomal protein L2
VVSRDITKQTRKRAWCRKEAHGRTQQHRSDFIPIMAAATRVHREIDFKRDKTGIAAVVPPSNTIPTAAPASLLHYVDGEKRYILAPGPQVGRKIFDPLQTFWSATFPLKNIPAYTVVHNIELKPGKGGQMACSVGASAAGFSRRRLRAAKPRPANSARCWWECVSDHRPGGQCRARNVSLGSRGRKR